MSSSSSYSSESLADVDPLDKPVDILPTGAVVGRYVILHLLGHGAAGLVYAAYDAELDRKLALKFLRLRGDSEAIKEASHRLRREAQAMARLSHPNVVSIHDVGRVSGHMFLVMDFVPGGTLKQWLAEARPWPERLQMLCKAGDGLAAAHSAGVVHRDFKPSNVLVDGAEPRVTDFGIAAAEAASHSLRPPPPAPDAPASASPEAAPGEERLTTGVLGTIGYLAPEQAFLAQVDARSDQFSFCVTLYFALYGVLPFPNDDLLSYVNAIGKRAITPPASAPGVPRSVHAAIVRGLSENPDERFPSMAALLTELRTDRGQIARRRWVVAGLVALGALLVALFVRARASERASLCPAPDATLGGAWTPAARDKLRGVFTAAAPFGASTFAPLGEALDRYATGVATMRRDSCLAARVNGTQSETVMTLRLQCLDDRAQELGTLVQLFGSADEKVVSGAAQSLAKLSPVAECANTAALAAPVPPPTPAIAASVEAMRKELAEVHAVQSVGRYAEAADRAGALETRAEQLHYAPLMAETRFALGAGLVESGHHDQAEKTLRAAIDTADEGKDDLLRGKAYSLLSLVQGRRLGHYDAAIVSATTALHIARRVGSERLEASALEQLGMAHGQTGQLAEGLEESTAALAIRERLGPEDLDCASVHVAISVALSELGRFDDSQREDRKALAISDRILGTKHPTAAVYRVNLSVDLVWAGRPEEAVPVTEEAIQILHDSVGTEHPDYALALNTKGYALTKLGRFAEALAVNQEAAAIEGRVEGPDAASASYPLVGTGEDLIELGRAAEALPILEHAARIADASGLDPETMGECHFQLARAVWLVTRDRTRADALARKAIADYQRSPRLAARAREAEAFAAERESAPSR